MQACEVAFQNESEVQHPLLDRVRQCSAAPDQAASFFLQLFHPVPQERVKAIEHKWCVRTVMSMLGEMDRAAEALAAAAEDKAKLKKSSSLKQRAARFLCCSSASTTLEAGSHVGHDRSPAEVEIKACKWWKLPQLAKRRHQRSRDVAACSDASVHSQNAALQAESCQRPARTVFQGIRFGESRQAHQQVTEELPHVMADPVQSPMADGFDTTSVALPKQPARVRAVSMTASASSAHEPQVQSLQQQHEVADHKHDKDELLEQHCPAGMEGEQVVGGAPLPEELQEHVVDTVSDR